MPRVLNPRAAQNGVARLVEAERTWEAARAAARAQAYALIERAEPATEASAREELAERASLAIEICRALEQEPC